MSWFKKLPSACVQNATRHIYARRCIVDCRLWIVGNNKLTHCHLDHRMRRCRKGSENSERNTHPTLNRPLNAVTEPRNRHSRPKQNPKQKKQNYAIYLLTSVLLRFVSLVKCKMHAQKHMHLGFISKFDLIRCIQTRINFK